jgi:hypothetical protein
MHSLFAATEQISPFLRLPLELRREIYRHALPHTTSVDVGIRVRKEESDDEQYLVGRRRTLLRLLRVRNLREELGRSGALGNDIVWRRGCTRLLAVNHQIHDECAEMMYGENTFVIHVSFDSIKFHYQWLVASTNLKIKGTKDFIEHFSQRNLLRIKNYIVNVEHVDDYAGMIKYNCGGRGLTAGIREQVQTLIDLLVDVPYLRRLQIHMINTAGSRARPPDAPLFKAQDHHNLPQPHSVLDPFMRLYEVRQAKVTGVSPEYAAMLERSMTASRNGNTA